ncbi:MAG TPA: hypothetical protein VGK48_22105 [Terriglobia bacterium]|jgi:hypothetical protein
MLKRTFYFFCILAGLCLAAAAVAQEGHPLSGTWSGDWGPSVSQRTHLTLVMSWDGKNVSGVLNPGDNAVQIPSIFLDVTNWSVRIEADSKDPSGKTVHITAEGKLDDIGSYHRKLSGSWMQGTAKGDFRLTRD